MTTEPQGGELPEDGGVMAEETARPELAHEESGEFGEEVDGFGDEPAGVDEETTEYGDEAGEFGEEPAGVDQETSGLHQDEETIGLDEEAGEDEVYEELGDDGVFQPSPMRQVAFINLEVFLPSTNPVMVLRELDEPFRELRITIGSPEGVAIAYGWRGIDTPRPLTHELFTEVFERFGLSLEVVRITDVRGTAYSGEIVVNGPQGSRVIQCRVSDAIALAVRQPLPVPIMVSPEVLEEVGSTEY